ncbi:unnamed protein product [Trichobilharzia regenti]|nr:unnamed protein product [Trichobilharzia regenti]
MPRKGPIYQIAWQPSAASKKNKDKKKEEEYFVVCYGSGLGNLSGDMSVWNFTTHEQLSSFKTVDVTSVQWCPDGEHLIFSTTTPRLRVNNGLVILYCRFFFVPVLYACYNYYMRNA